MSTGQGGRLLEVDALRGVAALAVVLFHHTTRYEQLYGTAAGPSFTVPHGHLGVNLFFVISGYVIFMTLERTRRAHDFVVSRFSRLFPAYWAALWITFAVTTTFGLPGKEVTLPQALANMLMFHGILRVPHVDGVYWTLEVELLFYLGMLALFVGGRLRQVHLFLGGLLALRVAYWVLAQSFNIELSWTLSRLLILKYIPWFTLGICVYQLIHHRKAAGTAPLWSAAAALVSLWLVDGLIIAALALLLAALVAAAAGGRLPWLRHPVLVFFGAISYPLYLLHENIGWIVIRELRADGWSADLTVVAAVGVSILLAWALTRSVERPAMRWIRGRYRASAATA